MPVAIRMYNTGFGDCFLLGFSSNGVTRRILIDCGMHHSAPGPFPMDRIVDDIIATLNKDAGGRLEAVVVTHRHSDHVSGFASPQWAAVEVEEVWMPWTEDPLDPVARTIRDRQSTLAKRLHLVLQKLQAAAQLDMVQNNLTNAKAMQTVHEGFRNVKRRRFLPEVDDNRNSFPLPALPDVAVHVLGPSRNQDVIRDMMPPEGEHYLRLVDVDGERSSLDPFPGIPSYARDAFEAFLADLDKDAASPRWLPLLDAQVRPQRGISMSRRQDKQFPKATAKAIREETDFDLFAIASSLEKAVNGTSLMLLFRVEGQSLLFPGDAQWGTWSAALQNPKHRQLLEQTSFFKVAHHGSHNATPVEFVEHVLPAESLGMVPTLHTKRWPFIPKDEILNALQSRGVSYVRSDADPGKVQTPFRSHPEGLYIEVDLGG